MLGPKVQALINELTVIFLLRRIFIMIERGESDNVVKSCLDNALKVSKDLNVTHIYWRNPC